jgi:hypothetical protein
MLPKLKLKIVPPTAVRRGSLAPDAFHEDRVREDLADFSDAPGVLHKYFQRARTRFRKAGERAILGHWESLYQAGERLIAAKVAMERQKSEYLQLTREHEVKDTEKTTELARLRADAEEHNLRYEKAAHQRLNVGQPSENDPEGARGQDEQQLHQACGRRDLDARWELNESLRPLQTLIELQRWRRQQRDRILKDRLLSPEEQSEDLKFVDDLYQQKHGALKVDTRIFDEEH